MFKRLFRGGTPVPHHKSAAEKETVVLPVPDKVQIPLLQHIGAVCEPTVQKGDTVKVGQIIGDSDKAMAAPIHSSVSGTVTAVEPLLWAGGSKVMTVEIQTDGKQELAEGLVPPQIDSRESFLKAVRASGLVGLGGAGFPAHIKLAPPADKKIDTLIINAAECEPYITSDYREILENSWNVLGGIKIVMENLGVKTCLVGIEDNKPKAIEELKKICAAQEGVKIVALPTRYPQGAEKMLIYALTKRKVPAGKLPSDVGVIVMNVTSASFLAQYVKTGMPLIKKKVTVEGPCVKESKNLEVLIGTPLNKVFEFAGGFTSAPTKVIMGGPMMGVAQHSLETSVVKHTNALLALDEKMGGVPEAGPCIKCGRCAKACPMGLMPMMLSQSALRNKTDFLEKFDINSCIECGSCSYVCPSKIQLVQTLRLGKNKLRAAAAKGGR